MELAPVPSSYFARLAQISHSESIDRPVVWIQTDLYQNGGLMPPIGDATLDGLIGLATSRNEFCEWGWIGVKPAFDRTGDVML